MAVTNPPRTVLVTMPFMAADRPSIQLGLLKAIGESHGFPIATLHANLDFAARLGLDRYQALCDMQGRQVGDWLFSVAAFGDAAPDQDATLLTEFAADLRHLDDLRAIRDHDVPAYLDALLEAHPWSDVDVVGFTSVFQQNVASFALARRLKDRFPGIVTVFGGANFDGEMGRELARSVECVDYAVIGEGDTAFPALLTALATGTDPAAVPGVAVRDRATPAAPFADLDAAPDPDYGEYFARAAVLEMSTADTWLPLESARGCWWGAKHHCVFCGLNGTSMRFRAKSPARVREELARQSTRYGNHRFEAVDNILDTRYLTELFPTLSGYELFYEVKANLSREQVRVLAEGGVTRAQPGIESLSSAVLRLMDKGVRASQNVNLLRWAGFHGIAPMWNILYGFPGETEEDYRRQAELVPHLVHLWPPASTGRVWLERFSPLFTRCPVVWRAPERSHHLVYPATVDVEQVAYVFEHELEGALPDSAYAPLHKAVAAWQEAWRTEDPPALVYQSSGTDLTIHDLRDEDRAGTYTFHDTLARIYLACTDRARTARSVHKELDLTMPVRAVEHAFTRFAERGLMFLDEDRALALALPAR